MIGMQVASNINMMIFAVLLIFCMYTDLKKRLIYNWVTFPGMAIGLVAGWLTGGTEGLVSSAIGLGTGFGLLFIFYLLRGIGAGDVKLLMMCGAFTGWEKTFMIFLAGSALGFLGSMYTILKHGGLANLNMKVDNIVTKEFLNKEAIKEAKKDSIPYGVFYGLAGLGIIIWGLLS